MQRLAKLGVPATAVLVIAMFISGVLTPDSYPGLPSTPYLTLLLTPIVRAALFVTGTIAVGLILVGGFLSRRTDLLRIAMRNAAAFAVFALAMIILTLANVMAVQPWQAFDLTIMTSFLTQIDEGRYLLLQVLFSALTAWILSRAQRVIELMFAGGAMFIAVLLPSFTGHSTASVSHWIASATMLLHLGAMTIWIGGAVALVFVRHDAELITKLSPIAIGAYALLIVSGGASLFARVSSWSDFFQDRYMWFVLAKMAVAVVLGILGFRHLRMVQTKFAGNAEALFQRTLAVEVSLMLVVIALAVTLARMANP